MNAYVALFRGINVGGKNKLPMKELVSLMEATGLKNVRSYIQSGNVVFRVASSKGSGLAEKIQDSILERHGFRPELLLLDGAAIDRAIADNPFPEADAEPSTVHLTFLSALPKSPDIGALESLRGPNERFLLRGQVFYLHAPDGIARSKLAARIEKAVGVVGTSRNWRTVRKIEEMLQTQA